MVNQKEFLSTLKKVVLSYDEKAEVILFGSRARGDFKTGSDWDILVLTDKEEDYVFQRKIRDGITDVELAYTQPLSTIIIHRNKWHNLRQLPFYKNVIAEGKTL